MAKSLNMKIIALCLFGPLCGCAPPTSMHVRAGGEPQHEDDDVLFRSTHYFRVFDFCVEQETAGKRRKEIQSDTLYRFRMTGKGKSWANAVRFESGTLRAGQIDPFGAAIEFDSKGKPYFVSQQKREEQRQVENQYEEAARLQRLAKDLKAEKGFDNQAEIARGKLSDALTLIGPGAGSMLADARSDAGDAVRDFIQTIEPMDAKNPAHVAARGELVSELSSRTEALKESRSALELMVAIDGAQQAIDSVRDEKLKQLTYAGEVAGSKNVAQVNTAERLKHTKKRLLKSSDSTSVATTSQAELFCPQGKPAKRGYQILGPEGWRTFDQEERLVLAMSSNGKPLLDALRQLSSRILAQKAGPGLSSDVSLTELLRAANARAGLAGIKADELEKSLQAIVDAFETTGGPSE